MRVFGLIGYPLAHSFSKKYFTEKFSDTQYGTCTYNNYPIESIREFPSLLQSVEGLEGLNVTVPYKEQVIPFLDSLSGAAFEMKAVNCIKIEKGQKTGFNTDVIGFKNSLQPLLKNKPGKGLILGTGGASKAVAYVLKELGIAYHFVSRRPVEGGFTYEELTEDVINTHQLIVNTTPLGTYPHVDAAPDIPYEFIGPRHVLHDLVYNPAETQFLLLGKRQGALIKNGYEMLIGQAEASWDIWNRGR